MYQKCPDTAADDGARRRKGVVIAHGLAGMSAEAERVDDPAIRGQPIDLTAHSRIRCDVGV